MSMPRRNKKQISIHLDIPLAGAKGQITSTTIAYPPCKTRGVDVLLALFCLALSEPLFLQEQVPLGE